MLCLVWLLLADCLVGCHDSFLSGVLVLLRFRSNRGSLLNCSAISSVVRLSSLLPLPRVGVDMETNKPTHHSLGDAQVKVMPSTYTNSRLHTHLVFENVGLYCQLQFIHSLSSSGSISQPTAGLRNQQSYGSQNGINIQIHTGTFTYTKKQKEI